MTTADWLEALAEIEEVETVKLACLMAASEFRAADAFAAAWARGPDSEETHAAHAAYLKAKE